MSSPLSFQPNQLGKQFAAQLIFDNTVNFPTGAYRSVQNSDFGQGYATTVSNSFITGAGIVSGIALAANPSRINFSLQPASISGAYKVLYGTGVITATNYSFLINPATGVGIAGQTYTDSVWKGQVNLLGSGSLAVLELQP